MFGLFGLFIYTGEDPSPKFHCHVVMLSVDGNEELLVKKTGLFSQVGEEKENAADGTDWGIITCCVIELLQ
jgi:hypothetical protein